jgi:peptide/nickel transport system permease protein
LKAYILRRLIQTIPSILTILVITFFLIHTMSGDPISMIVGEGFETDPAFVERMRERFGFDKPLHVQFILYMTNALQGNFGYSVFGPPVTQLILERLPATLLLTGSGLLFALIAGIILGVLAASKPSSLRSGVISAISVGGYAIPVFWLAQMMVILFALNLGWLPVSGMKTLREDYTGINHIIDVFKHLLLPSLALGIHQLALISRLTRSSMLETLREDYILTAKAKGLSSRKVVYWHALRNAVLPVVTVTGMQLGFLLAGAVLTETVFSWPGIGRLMYTSLLSRDYPVLMGIFIIISISVIIANLFTDLIYAYLDPRIQYE